MLREPVIVSADLKILLWIDLDSLLVRLTWTRKSLSDNKRFISQSQAHNSFFFFFLFYCTAQHCHNNQRNLCRIEWRAIFHKSKHSFSNYLFIIVYTLLLVAMHPPVRRQNKNWLRNHMPVRERERGGKVSSANRLRKKKRNCHNENWGENVLASSSTLKIRVVRLKKGNASNREKDALLLNFGHGISPSNMLLL